MNPIDQSVSARIWAHRDWVPLAQALVENSSPLFGLDRDRTDRLIMAVEEVVMHLAHTAPGSEIILEIIPGGWNVTATLRFAADPSDLWAMNLTAAALTEDEFDLPHLGLLLASRMVDCFDVQLQSRKVCLTLREDLAYPAATLEVSQRKAFEGPLSFIAKPDPDLVKEVCLLALGLYGPEHLHQSFFKPGKLADMVTRGDMNMAVALTQASELAGAVCWCGDSGVTFFGPYIFMQGDQLSSLLVEYLLQRVARTDARVLFSGRTTSDLPPGHFEYLGAYAPSAKTPETPVWYRHLGEDSGTSVWSHPEAVVFLEKSYQDLCLMRQIRVTKDLGEKLPERSVLFAQLRPRLGEALLVPLVGGRDMKTCLVDHVTTLHAEGFDRILFQTDLALGWQASLAQAALEASFSPRLILPYGGQSDLLVFQYESL
ncbi:hypothetical protein [Desulfopila sp. IMCC35008]|uniref:hypothetical protein n=1 Tax=Desulfopila sp. IMCC35008 TaxID=2653858 RepID=UPI0013D3D410|nr:hypothetical protein [Desulfopila sp. IMCC35008]